MMNTDAILARIREAAEEGLLDAAEVIKQEAIERAPKETGELRNSAETAQDGLEAVVYFDTPYAVRQHEELDWQHEDGEPKYLENAMIAKREVAGQVVAEAIRRAIGNP